MSIETSTTLFSLSLFLGALLALATGRWIGVRRIRRDPDGKPGGIGAVEGAVFGLVGLLLAFTFSGAASRFDHRRDLIVEETNAIGTAWLRVDLLPENAQPALRQAFRDYIDSRIETYRRLSDSDQELAKQQWAASVGLQGQIWNQAVAACREPGTQQAMMLLLPALNQMIDITSTRFAGLQMHPPQVIFAMLFILTLVASLLAGFAMADAKSPSWLHMIGFAAVMAITAYVILDIEYPRMGLIRVDQFDQLLVDLRASMN